MKNVLLLSVCVLLSSCGGEKENASVVSSCDPISVQGVISGLSYEVLAVEYGDSLKLLKAEEVVNGVLNYALDVSCVEGLLELTESLEDANCEDGFDYNYVDVLCEAKIFYEPPELTADAKIKVFNFENAVDVSALNLFIVKVNDVQTYSSNVQTEINDGKVVINNFLNSQIEVLSTQYESILTDGDEICFEFTSETFPHCYFYQVPVKRSQAVSFTNDFDELQTVDLSFLSEVTVLDGIGVYQEVDKTAVNPRGESVLTSYLELNHRAISVDVPFSIVGGELYSIEIKLNSENETSEAVVFIHDLESFNEQGFQSNYIEKIRINMTDASLREKKISYDFIGNPERTAERIKIVVYGENNILLEEIKIKKIDETFPVKGHTLFLSSEPSRSVIETHSVPDKFVPHGILGAHGYGIFEIDSILETYSIYVNYEDRFQTTQAHIYEKSSVTGDSLMGWNINGVDDSAAGGNSQDYLHGSRYQGLGWFPVKASPSDYAVILHSEGGHFALDNTNILINYNQFVDEESVGGVVEAGTRFNNRVSRKLANNFLREQNSNDPLAPIISLNPHTDYFPDAFGTAYAQDDGFGGVELTPYADGFGYSLTEDFLFYLYDDQGVTTGSGGPEGAIAGVLFPQVSYGLYRIENTLPDGDDFDEDGFSDRIEYISATDPTEDISIPDLDAYDFFPGDGDAFKVVNISISKEAQHFNIIVYEVLSNGVEKAIWSFDNGRGMESLNVYQAYEYEDFFELEIISNEISGVATDLRVEFY